MIIIALVIFLIILFTIGPMVLFIIKPELASKRSKQTEIQSCKWLKEWRKGNDKWF